MGKRSAVVELFLGDMGSMQRELRPSTQREDQLTMETKLEQIAVKAVNQLPKSVVREIRTPRSVGAGGGRPPPATRCRCELGARKLFQAVGNPAAIKLILQPAGPLVVHDAIGHQSSPRSHFGGADVRRPPGNRLRFLTPRG